MSSMFAETRDGVTIAYQIRGAPDHPRKLTLVHSLALDHSFWGPVVDLCKDDCAILTVDCRGHGRSGHSAAPFTITQFADDLADVLTAAGWRTTTVAGASMGGSVAQAFAARYPDRADGLGLFDTTAWYGPDAPAAWEQRARKALSEGLSGLVHFQKTRWFSDGFREAHPDVVQACLDVFLRNDLECYAKTCRMLGAMDLRDVIGSIRCPTRILVGSEDYATPPEMAQTMHARIPGSTLRELPGARHLSPLESPHAVADDVRRLIRGTP